MKETESFYQLALTTVSGVGAVLIRQLISYCGSATDVFRTPVAKLTKIPGIGLVTAREIRKPEILRDAESIWEHVGQLGVRLLFYTDKQYPTRLKPLYDAPPLLYLKGSVDLNALRTIGIVGTRQATVYGRQVTEDLIQALTPFKPLIISGLAYGIDIAAHRASLQNQLPTVGVMASGVDVIYPSVHRKTAFEMQERGGLLTESQPGIKPDARLFPARNRIIAGLSDVLIVVEAAIKGGALITAEYANNYHRDVFAVPGQLSQTFSQGCNKLIREHKAHIYTNPTDLIQTMNWNMPHSLLETSQISLLHPNFTEEESQVLALLRNHPGIHIDELSWQCRLPMNRLASLLLNLEFKGVLYSLPGKKYQLI